MLMLWVGWSLRKKERNLGDERVFVVQSNAAAGS